MKNLFLLFAFFGIFASTANAACDTASCNDTIDRIVLWSGGGISIDTAGTETSITNCVPDANKYINIPTAHPNRDEIYSLLLSAKIAGKVVYLRTKDTPGSACEVDYALIDS